MKTISTLDEHVVHGLSDLYDAEHRFLEALKTMLEHASDAGLKKLIREHVTQTEEQIANLEEAYTIVGAKAKRVKCDAAAGLVSEGEKGLKEAAESPELLDCMIASSLVRVEHYEIAGYRSLVAAAETKDEPTLVELLRRNLEQEELTAQKIETSTNGLLRKARRAESRSEA